MPRSLPRPSRAGTAVALFVAAAALMGLAGCEAKQRQGDLVAGKQEFVKQCGACHVLRRANTTGVVGPNLDEAFQQAIRDGFKRSTIRGVTEEQILIPRVNSIMWQQQRQGKITDDRRVAENIAAYVAAVAARPGEDTGALAKAVSQVKRIPVARAQGGQLTIEAFPDGQLLYVPQAAQAPPGPLAINSPNKAAVPHNIALQGAGVNAVGPVISGGAVSTIRVNVRPGQYTFLCTVPGHAAAGMQGRLTVR
jgi:mono/diheme cytochrome c family protein